MVKVRNFHEDLERDLQKLTVEIKEQKEISVPEPLSEKEVVKRSIQSLASQSPAIASSTTEDSTIINPALPNYLQASDPGVKLEVEKLIDLVFHESIVKAVAEAKKHSPFVEDAFHDALVDKLLPELKKRGAF